MNAISIKEVVDRYEVVVDSYRVHYGSTVISIEPEVWNEEQDSMRLIPWSWSE